MLQGTPVSPARCSKELEKAKELVELQETRTTQQSLLCLMPCVVGRGETLLNSKVRIAKLFYISLEYDVSLTIIMSYHCVMSCFVEEC